MSHDLKLYCLLIDDYFWTIFTPNWSETPVLSELFRSMDWAWEKLSANERVAAVRHAGELYGKRIEDKKP